MRRNTYLSQILGTIGVITLLLSLGGCAAYGTPNSVQANDATKQPTSRSHKQNGGGSVASLQITTNHLPNGTAQVPYNMTLVATGGVSPYRWSLNSGSLPSGLSLNSPSGAISGMPSQAGGYTFTVQAKDSDAPAQTATNTITITIANTAAPLQITTSSLPGGQVSASYLVALTATGGTLPYTWSVLSGSLPSGLSLNTSIGAISGTPSQAGTFTFALQLKDANGQTTQQSSSLVIAAAPIQPLSITSSALPQARVSQAYSAALQATGGTPGYTWSMLSGSLPQGVTLSASGLISGTPTASGQFSCAVLVKDSAASPQTASATLSLTVASAATSPLQIVTTSVPSGTVQAAYSTTVVASGGTAPYSWSVTSGSLPAGLSLSTSGAISGTPSVAGQYSFTVQVKDAEATPQVATQTYAMGVAAAPAPAPAPLQITTSSLAGGQVSVSYQATLAATGGTAPYSWSVIGGQLPTGLTLSATGTISGTPTVGGAFTFITQVKDSAGQSTSSTLSINITAPSTSPGAPTLAYTVARTDTNPATGAAPAIGAAGTVTTDPDFSMRVLRVTQSGSCPGGGGDGFGTAAAGWKPMWNKDTSKVLIYDLLNGFWYFQGIDTVNFTTSGPCTRVVPEKLSGFPGFSSTNTNRIYGLGTDGVSLAYFDTAAGISTNVFNLTTIPGFRVSSLYLVDFDSNDGWFCTSNNSQDLGTQIGCYNNSTGATQVLDLAAATSQQGTSAPIALDNLTASQLAGCGVHTIIMGRGGDWLHAELNSCTAFPTTDLGSKELFWQLGTNHVTYMPWHTGGHQSSGWNGAFVNNGGAGSGGPGSIDGPCTVYDQRGWSLWFATNFGTTGTNAKWAQVNSCIAPLAPALISTDAHQSWLNNVNDSNANRYPLLIMDIDPFTNTNYLVWEIAAIEMAPGVDLWNSGTSYRTAVSSERIWRFAHTYNDPINAQCAEMGYLSPNISPDGKYALFPSDWQGQTGTGGCTNSRRLDVFIVELK